MSWTKLDIVKAAFEEIGFATYVYDASSEQLESILRRLDMMVSTWYANGVNLGYPIYNDPKLSTLDQASNLPVIAVEAVYLGLAVRIAPMFGKVLNPDTKINAQNAFNAMINSMAEIPEKSFPSTLPAGAGNIYNWNNFIII